jgi:S1-C subfamily serine protease
MAESSTGDGGILTGLSNDFARAVERAAGTTVRVNARRRQSASGVIWAAGTILTTDHVIEREEEITLGLPDGTEVPATLTARDPGTDLAVLKADMTLAPIERGPIPGVGSLVLAVARPDSQGPQATLGVVSAVAGPARTWRGGQLDQFIRSDAVLYPGFSGGPLIDSLGRAIGINSSHLARGSGIAIPAQIAGQVVEALLSHGHVRRGYLGISSQPVALPAAAAGKAGGQTSGLLILRVEPDAPAEKGGVIIGDILTALAGEPVRDVDDLQRLLGADVVGRAVPAQVLRGGEPKELTVQIGERP